MDNDNPIETQADVKPAEVPAEVHQEKPVIHEKASGHDEPGHAQAHHSQKKHKSGFRIIFLSVLCMAVLGEALIFMQKQLSEINDFLLDDFRIVISLESGMGRDRAMVAGEKIRSVPGVLEVVYTDKNDRLKKMQEYDPDVV